VLSIPPDFLRLTPSNFQVVADHEAAMALHQQQIGFPAFGLAVSWI